MVKLSKFCYSCVSIPQLTDLKDNGVFFCDQWWKRSCDHQQRLTVVLIEEQLNDSSLAVELVFLSG